MGGFSSRITWFVQVVWICLGCTGNDTTQLCKLHRGYGEPLKEFLLTNQYHGMQQDVLIAPGMIVMMFAVILTGGNKPLHSQPD